ncbi:MAG: hypothetical protein WBB47_13950 [Paenisporosarcina sp.]|uniref:hypothetical protein n=1 Tax=Paenisporosarcina sp. TaxID=1932001 RepID=UPI003C713030
MDPSKEFDELFQKMQHIDRSNDARRNSLLKLQDKVGRKKRYVAPIFISIAMVAVACFLFFSLVKTENPSNHLAAEIADEDKNKEAVRAVLESELTVPNEEYNLIVQNIDKKMDEISGGEIPSDSAEFQAYQDLVKKTYGPYFMDYAYDKLITNSIAFRYHYGFFGYEEFVRYEMKVSDIQVTKSENESSPKNYDFTAQVEYTDNDGKVTQHEVKGMAILSEPGKIGKFEIHDDTGLEEKISVDQQDNVNEKLFELSSLEEQAYNNFLEDLDLKHLSGLEPISIAKLYIYAGYNRDSKIQYALYTDRKDRIQWSKEEDENFPDSDRATEKQVLIQFKNFEKGTFVKTSDYEGYIEFEAGEGSEVKSVFQMIQNEDGIWQVAFMPIQ